MAETSLRERRLRNEQSFLEMLLSLNAGRLELIGNWKKTATGDEVQLRLCDSPAYLLNGTVTRDHILRIVLPEYFPSTPTEGWLGVPVLHPNVHPVNGFICLWAKHSPGDTIVETLLQTQRVISWQLFNLNPEHVMQPSLDPHPPLHYEPLIVPESYWVEKTHAERRNANPRRRLSPLPD